MIGVQQGLMRICETRSKSVRIFAHAHLGGAYATAGRFADASMQARVALELSSALERADSTQATFPHQVCVMRDSVLCYASAFSCAVLP